MSGSLRTTAASFHQHVARGAHDEPNVSRDRQEAVEQRGRARTDRAVDDRRLFHPLSRPSPLSPLAARARPGEVTKGQAEKGRLRNGD